jgi:hypothetical protein
MGPGGVQQLAVLSDLFALALRHGPESVAILGVAGGNGLDRIDRHVTRRVAGIDINPAYLDIVRSRYGGVELHCVDLSKGPAPVEPVSLVHAALFFEHAGVDPALDHALQLVQKTGGRMCVVLQLPSTTAEAAVSNTGYASIQKLKDHFQFVDPQDFRQRMSSRGFTLEQESTHPLYGGKALWFAMFSSRR